MSFNFNFGARERYVRAGLIILICLTICFIFGQSMLPPVAVEKESHAVAGLLAHIFSPDSSIYFLIRHNLANIAHFCEYGILGLFTSMYVAFFCKQKIAKIVALGFVETVAIIDETIQIFSGRSQQITDILIDIFGFATISIITYVALFLIVRHINRGEING